MVSCSTCLLWAIGYFVGGFILVFLGLYLIFHIKAIGADHNSHLKNDPKLNTKRTICKLIFFVVVGFFAVFIGIDLIEDGVLNLIRIV